VTSPFASFARTRTRSFSCACCTIGAAPRIVTDGSACDAAARADAALEAANGDDDGDANGFAPPLFRGDRPAENQRAPCGEDPPPIDIDAPLSPW
jgi:hypothetical protein